jgi:uncharacterized protein (TIRG00374 family)
MSKTFGTLLKVVLSIGLAALIMYYVFRNIDFKDFVKRLDDVNYGWIYLTMLISLIGYILRAYRWRLQLEPLGFKPTVFRMFLALMTGYMTNLLVPRLGEVTRCGVLFKNDRVPVSTGIGTVITERIVDLIALVVILFIAFLVQSEQLIAFINQTVDFNVNWVLFVSVFLVVSVVGLWVFVRFVYPSQTKVGAFIREMVKGLLSLKSVRLTEYLLSTLGIWVIYFLMSYLVVFAIPETAHLPWLSGFSILSAGVIAFVLPVQSGFGTFHALVAVMLALYGIDNMTGVFFASLLHTSQLIAALAFGLVAFVIALFIKRRGNEK